MPVRTTTLFARILAFSLAATLVVTLTMFGKSSTSFAQAKTIYIGIDLPLTGADAEDATLIKDGALMAIDETNAKGGVAGYKLEAIVLNDATATAGQYDPAQAATNARQMVANVGIVAAVGPQMSGAGKAMSPILSEGGLATITPSSTNPDITDPKFASQYRPGGKAIYFRTVTTDAYQGPNMANFYAETLHAKSVYVLDDSGAYGVGIADTFQKQAAAKGIKVLGRDQLNPKEADYTTVLTKIKGLSPDAIYYGGVDQAGAKLAKQAYDVMPKLLKGGGDGMYSANLLKGAGFPASNGWYATIAGPHLTESPALKPWVTQFHTKYGSYPGDYSITSYDAMLVIIDAIKRVAAGGKPVTRDAVRDAIQNTHLQTLQGVIEFDQNGDIKSRVVSVFQVVHNTEYQDVDILHQFKYIGVAPQN
ncbi:MAG TPA: branched-chain amino acid ABC transporter substrate-binding protein [bacterium]|nr:branched-chain amino acid ABC transporter substrate-binding protein [bacterium]